MKEFRFFDLFLLSILALVAGICSDYFITQMYSNFYYSLRTAVLLIALIRWGKYGVFPIFVSSVGMAIFSHMFGNFTVVDSIWYYCMADLFLAVPMLCYGNRDRDIIPSKWHYLAGYVVLSHITLTIGKGVAIFIVTGEVTGAIDYFAANFTILVIDCIVVLLLRNVKGLITDIQKLLLREGREDG